MGSLLLFFTAAQILYIATHPNKRRKCKSGFGKHFFYKTLTCRVVSPLTDFKVIFCSALPCELS